uniref:DUF218 domain-containing protein n=1 Tax=Kalanchoe fedtschenkoi TaxID=63787 RepID=A0A7N0TPL8_KALFE
MSTFQFGSNSPKLYAGYSKGDIDLELGSIRKPKRSKPSPSNSTRMFKSFLNWANHCYNKLQPMLLLFIVLSFAVIILIILSLYRSNYQDLTVYQVDSSAYPFAKLQNLVMVAGHSVYTSSSCGKADEEGSWFLESYQKHPGQAATFLDHIRQGVELTARDDNALLLFSGGETRKDAGPRSEAQSYWMVAESKSWFGNQESVRWRTLTEEHARDSFENLLFSVCRFRELTGSYPQNITVVSYDFKEDRFTHLHRSAIGFPEGRFFYSGTPTLLMSKSAATKGEAVVKAQFEQDPYGCFGSLRRKKSGRDPFHRSIPYPNGCPELKGLFRHCRADLFPGTLPWRP